MILFCPQTLSLDSSSLRVLSTQTARDCWTVAFGNAYTDEDRCLVAGYDNGDVKLFDLRTQSMRWETNVKNGVTGLDFDRNDIEMNKVGYNTGTDDTYCSVTGPFITASAGQCCVVWKERTGAFRKIEAWRHASSAQASCAAHDVT